MSQGSQSSGESNEQPDMNKAIVAPKIPPSGQGESTERSLTKGSASQLMSMAPCPVKDPKVVLGPSTSLPAAPTNNLSTEPKPNKPVKMGTATVIGATPITFRSEPISSGNNGGIATSTVGFTGGKGRSASFSQPITVMKSKFPVTKVTDSKTANKTLSKSANKVKTGLSGHNNFGDNPRTIESSSTVSNANMLSSVSSGGKNLSKPLPQMTGSDPIPTKSSTSQKPAEVSKQSTSSPQVPFTSTTTQQSVNDIKGSSLSKGNPSQSPATSIGVSSTANATTLLPQPLQNPDITTVLQDILLLLQTYGPLTLYQLEFNLPSYKSTTLTNRVRDLKDILDILIVVGVLYYLNDDNGSTMGLGNEQAASMKENESNDCNKEELKEKTSQLKPGRYVYVTGRLRAPGDSIYPWEILDKIQDANVEISERLDRIQWLKKELSSSTMSPTSLIVNDEKEMLDIKTKNADENLPSSSDWNAFFQDLQDRDIRSGGNLAPTDILSSNQRIKSTREFFKTMFEKFPEIGQDPVYIAAMRNFSVDLGAAGRSNRSHTGNRKRMNSGGVGTATKRNRPSNIISTPSKLKVLSSPSTDRQKPSSAMVTPAATTSKNTISLMSTKDSHLEQPVVHPSPKTVEKNLDVTNPLLVSTTTLNEKGDKEQKNYQSVTPKSYQSNTLKVISLKDPSGLVEESDTTKENK